MLLSEKIKELGLLGTRRLWTRSCMRLMSYLGLMEITKLQRDQCCNMNGLSVHNTNQWSYQNLTEQQSENLHLGPLILGVWLSKTEELRDTASLPKLNSSKLIEHNEYFQNKLVDTIHFMEILKWKDSIEKDTFFCKLPNLVEQLPRQIGLKKLFPLLTSALEFGSAPAHALTALLKMGSRLSPEEFSTQVVPTIVNLFASNEWAIRVGLLQHIDRFGESLSSQIVDEQICSQIR